MLFSCGGSGKAPGWKKRKGLCSAEWDFPQDSFPETCCSQRPKSCRGIPWQWVQVTCLIESTDNLLFEMEIRAPECLVWECYHAGKPPVDLWARKYGCEQVTFSCHPDRCCSVFAEIDTQSSSLSWRENLIFVSSSKDILTVNDGDTFSLWSSFCWVWGPQCWWCHQKPNWRWSYWDSVKHYFDSLSTWLCHCRGWVTDCWEIIPCEPLGLLGKKHTKSFRAFLSP